MIRYLVAKYVDDLSRNEPTNIGVVIYDGSRAIARFDGEDDNAKMDLRRVRSRISGSRAYRSWVDYWRSAMESPGQVDRGLKDAEPGDSRVVEHLIASSGRDFYLEHGGTILLDADGSSPEELLKDLFARLVRQPDPPSPPTLREKSKEALARAGAPMDDVTRFIEQKSVRLDVQGVSVEDEVSFAVKNGTWHYLQEMPFNPEKIRLSRKEATHCLFLFEHMQDLRESGVILYDGSDITSGQYALLEMLMNAAPEVVDVNATDAAAEKLHDRLQLGSSEE